MHNHLDNKFNVQLGLNYESKSKTYLQSTALKFTSKVSETRDFFQLTGNKENNN
jgi:hypothetical protein